VGQFGRWIAIGKVVQVDCEWDSPVGGLQVGHLVRWIAIGSVGQVDCKWGS
jgi:hypothetical protein